MNTENKRLILRDAFIAKLPLIIRSEQENIGPGLYLKVKRILKFRSSYLKNILSRLLNRRLQGSTKLFWGRKVILPFDDSPALRLHYYGSLVGNELSLIAYLINSLKDNDIFYDVGANYGFYSYLAQELITKGEVHSFEPSPTVFPYLKINTNQPNIHANDIALSDHTGTHEFYDTIASGQSGASSLLKDRLSLDNKNVYALTNVKTMTLDEYVQTHTPPTFIKLDVEGAESLVIQGGMNTLRTFHPTIAMEVWSGKKGNKFHRKAIELLSSLNYSANMTTINGELKAINIHELPIQSETERDFDNILFIHQDNT